MSDEDKYKFVMFNDELAALFAELELIGEKSFVCQNFDNSEENEQSWLVIFKCRIFKDYLYTVSFMRTGGDVKVFMKSKLSLQTIKDEIVTYIGVPALNNMFNSVSSRELRNGFYIKIL